MSNINNENTIDSDNNNINTKIVFSDEVQSAVEQVLQSTDPLDQPDFNPTDYINQLFPNEQSLSNIDDVIIKMEYQIRTIDDNIRDVVRGQSNTGQDGRMALEEAQNVIIQLFSQVTEIKTRAEKTEEMVKEITRDIKQLDCAKKNLTSAITTLNHLHMLVGGVESLNKLAEKRLYGEILNPLQAITEVNQHFQQYTDIPEIQALSAKVAQIHTSLATQITEDFHNSFQLTASNNNNNNNNNQKISIAQLTDALQVVSVLDTKVKRDLIKWFINQQLQEYVQLFHENQDIAWLDKIDKRYGWLKRHLLDFEAKFLNIFPIDWELSERITIEFCIITRNELKNLMKKRLHEIDVKLLLYSITKTQQFEQLLNKKFTGITLNDNNNIIIKQTNNDTDLTISNNQSFIDIIGVCFKSYLDIYTDSIDRNLSELIEHFVLQQATTNAQTIAKPSVTTASSTSSASSTQTTSIVTDDNIDNKSIVFPSCADLFVTYKKCMIQCTQLSNDKPLYDLTIIFKKYLREYANRVLENNIPKTTSNQPTIGASMSLLTRDLQNLSTAAGQVIHSFLKEGETPRYTKDELIRICCILTTSEYCLETIQQLEDKLKEKITKYYANSIDLSDEKDLYHRIISTCIQLLVHDVDIICDSSLILMQKIQWNNINMVGDQSQFINILIKNFKITIPIIRDNLYTSRKYYIQFLHKFVNTFIPKYINTLYKCRPTTIQQLTSSNQYDSSNHNINNLNNNSNSNINNILGCEQLLLDTHSLKTVLLDLPIIGSLVNRKPPTSYTKVVIKGMTKAEMIIKLVMTHIYPVNVFIEQFIKLLPDSNINEFHKILDMKGIKRIEQQQLIDLYKRNVTAKEQLMDIGATGLAQNEQMNISNTLVNTGNSITSLIMGNITNNNNTENDTQESNDRGRIRKLEKLIKKRLPN